MANRRPDTIPIKGQDLKIDWLTRHVGRVVVPHPSGLIGQSTTLCVLSDPANEGQCHVVIPAGTSQPDAQMHAELLGVIYRLAEDAKDLGKRVTALERSGRVVS